MSKAYQVVTERIIEKLEQGTIPWRKPWGEGGSLGEHQNLVSGKAYRGINAIMTAAQGYTKPYWLTFKQASDHGGRVRKGEKGTPIVYWMFLEKEKDGERDRIPMAKYSTVFNIDQIEGMESIKEMIAKKGEAKPAEFSPIEEAEKILAKYKGAPPVMHHEQRAYYRPAFDQVNMPTKESFSSPEEYYSTLFHEMVHSTGHRDRLGREGITETNYFGSHSYSKEELIAEMGAAFLAAKAGIEHKTLENSASYIASWLKTFKSDPKMVLQAASAAQKAADLIQGLEKKEEE